MKTSNLATVVKMRLVALDNARRNYAGKAEAHLLAVSRHQAIQTTIASETEAQVSLTALDQNIAGFADWLLEARRTLAASMIVHVNANAEALRARNQLAEAFGALGIAENMLSGKFRSERRAKEQEFEAELSTISLSPRGRVAAHQRDSVATNAMRHDL